jgi:D-alanyl-D-alanine carboxypeptidase
VEMSRARSDFQRLLSKAGMHAWLLETLSGQRLVGHLDWTEPNEPFVEIAPDCRLHGYATQALDRVSRFRDDLSGLCFEIESSDKAARFLLEKCGYQCVPESPGTRARYTIIKGQQRQITLELLDSQYQQAKRDQVLAIHQDLNISRDYARLHQLELAVEATELTSIGNDIHGRTQNLTPNASVAWKALVQAAAEDGESLQPVSAYRSISYQESIIRRKLDAGTNITEILKVSAAPGYSEHHSGCAVDIGTPGSAVLEEEFENTSAFAWLSNNGDRFGCSLSYPRTNKHQIAYEPWHWAFVS